MAQGSHRFGKCAVLLTGVMLLAMPQMLAASAAAAQGSPAPVHRLGCVLISGRLYLGDPGASSHPRFVICNIHFSQVHPRSDGVILVLRQAHHRSTYSILTPHFGVRPFGRALLRWRRHPAPVKITCALAGRRLYLGSTGPARPRKKATCSVRFYQMSPAADGVITVLRTAHHTTAYSIVLRKLPHHPTGSTPIRWTS
jgi:hypothetical protein